MLGMDSPGLDGSKPNIQAVILSSRTLNFVCCLATMHTFCNDWMNCLCSWLVHGTWSAKHKSPTLPSLSLEVTLKKCFIWSSIFTWHDKMSRPFWSIIVQLHGTVKSADVPKLKVHSPHSVLDSRLFSPCKVPPQHYHQGAQTDNFRHYSDRIELIWH